MGIRICLFTLFYFTGSMVWAGAFPKVGNLSISRTTTTDGFILERLGMSYQPLTDLNWPFKSEPTAGKSLGADLLFGKNKDNLDETSLFQLSLNGVIKKSAKFSYAPTLGFTYLNNNEEGSRVTPYAGLNLDYKSPKLYLKYGLLQKSQADVFIGKASPLFYNQGINNILNLSYHPFERIFLRSRNTTGHWKDGENRFLSDNSILYGLSIDDRWFLIGPGFSYLSYNKRNIDYWSPKYFKSYGLQAELALPLISKWSMKMGGALNKFREEDFEEGSGHYVRGGIFYGIREKHLISFELESNQSKQRDNEWKSSSVIINIQIPI